MKIKQTFYDLACLLVIVCLSFLAILPLLHSGFFPMHDNTQVARIYEMGKALKDGMFPVRWVSDLGYGYGYPLFNFYAPLAYYMGGLLIIFGANVLLATKITMILGVLFSGISMYFLAKAFFGRIPAILSSLLYVYATYHAVDIYVRGDLAEFYAYAFIPLAFYGIWKSYETRKWSYITLGAFGFAAVILSHNLTAFMISPFLAAVAIGLSVVAYKKNRKGAFAPLTSLIFGVLLSAFYWIPVFSEMKYTNVLSQIGRGADFRDHFVCLSQFWYSPWGYGGSVPGCNDGLSFMIGKIHIFLAILGFFSGILLIKKYKKQAISLIVATLLFLCGIFFAVNWSLFLWKLIPQMAFLQYPWRFLVIISFAASFLGGGFLYTVNVLFQKKHAYVARYGQLTLATVFILLLLFFQRKFFVPQSLFQADSNSFTNTHAMWIASKISDEYMPKNFKKPSTEREYVINPLLISSYRGSATLTLNKTQMKGATIRMDRLEPFVLMQAYFPAWHVYLDHKEIPFTPVARGLLVNFPIGTMQVMLLYCQTAIEMIANWISLAGIIGLLLGIIFSERKFSHGNTNS